MKLLVGLGNPGPKYEATRHNAGFLVVDWIAEDAGLSWQDSKFEGAIAKGKLDGQDIVMLKPLTFMNLSGRSVARVVNFFKIKETDIAVVYDDVDVPSGSVKAKWGGGHGGHNGVRSIIAESGLSGFYRIKLGIGKPGSGQGTVADWVLDSFTDAELLRLQKEMLDAAKLRLTPWLTGQIPANSAD